MIGFAQTGERHNDGTASYKIVLDREYNVQEFINEVLKNKKEWGYIGIKSDNFLKFFGEPFCEYRYGKLLNALPNHILSKSIKSVNAHSGRSRMDYILELKDLRNIWSIDEQSLF